LKRLLKRAEKEGRKDDTKEVIENRIQIYNSQTQPLIEFYINKKKFQSLHGIGGVDEIFAGICKIIDHYIN
jgi:adenylate kinase